MVLLLSLRRIVMAKLKKTLPKEFLDMCNTHSNVWTSEEIDECKQLLSGSEPDATPRGGKTTSLHTAK